MGKRNPNSPKIKEELPRRIHSHLSPKCEARETSHIHRYGVFAKEPIKKGEVISIWGGFKSKIAVML